MLRMWEFHKFKIQDWLQEGFFGPRLCNFCFTERMFAYPFKDRFVEGRNWFRRRWFCLCRSGFVLGWWWQKVLEMCNSKWPSKIQDAGTYHYLLQASNGWISVFPSMKNFMLGWAALLSRKAWRPRLLDKPDSFYINNLNPMAYTRILEVYDELSFMVEGLF